MEIDGMITTIVEGGTGGYNYEWNTNETTEQITGLVAGNYSVTILDENQCQVSGAATIIEPDLVDLAVTEVVDALCFGENTGSITLSGTGGSGNFEYSADGVTFQNNPILTDLGAGDYTLTVRDPNGCTETTTMLGQAQNFWIVKTVLTQRRCLLPACLL